MFKRGGGGVRAGTISNSCLGVLPQENFEIWSAQGVILGLQFQIRNFMVWIYMGSNLSWRGVWGSSPQANLEIWSAQRVILGLSRAQSKIRNFMVWIFMGSGVFGGSPPRKFRNMKCSRSDSRPILGFGFVNGGFEILWCEYLWQSQQSLLGGGGVWGCSPKKSRNMKCSRSDFRPILGLLRVSS